MSCDTDLFVSERAELEALPLAEQLDEKFRKDVTTLRQGPLLPRTGWGTLLVIQSCGFPFCTDCFPYESPA